MNKIPSESRTQVPVLSREDPVTDLDFPSICLTWVGLLQRTTLHIKRLTLFPGRSWLYQEWTADPKPAVMVCHLPASQPYSYYHLPWNQCSWFIFPSERLPQLSSNYTLISVFTLWCFSSLLNSKFMRVGTGSVFAYYSVYQLAQFLTHSRHLINWMFFLRWRKDCNITPPFL